MTAEPITKSEEAYKTISEVANSLGLTTSTLRFWEKEFKQIRPTLICQRRYYSNEIVSILKIIKSLLYEQGYTLLGAKKHLTNLNTSKANTETKNPELKIRLKNLISTLHSAQDALL